MFAFNAFIQHWTHTAFLHQAVFLCFMTENFKYTLKHKHTMPFKTLTIKKSAYDRLKRMKRKGESFTDVIVRITEKRVNLWDLYGILKDSETSTEEMLANVKEMRKDMDESFKRRQDALSRL